MEKLWTTAEAAEHLRIPEADVEQLVRHGKLTGYRLGGKFLRFRPDEVKALQGAVSPRAPSAPPARARPAAKPWQTRLRDALYFYDFYLLSSALLICLVLYLIASS